MGDWGLFMIILTLVLERSYGIGPFLVLVAKSSSNIYKSKGCGFIAETVGANVVLLR